MSDIAYPMGWCHRPNVTFLSYNSTGMNTIKSRWIRDLSVVTDASFIQIQEHFKTTQNTDKFFAEQFPDYNGLPGCRDKYQDRGRAKGGLAQLSKTKLDVKKNRVQCSNFRIQAQTLHFPAMTILWLNSYFPTDPQLINHDETDLETLLNDLENIMDSTQFDEVILGGDLNWDKSRNTGFASCIQRWVSRIGLQDVWDTFPVEYTHVHTDLKSLSTLDRFLVSPSLLPHISDAGAINFSGGDNPSRHSPIMMRISMDSLPVHKVTPRSSPHRPAWYKACEADINCYTFELNEKLARLHYPCQLDCLDPHCCIASG